MASQLDAHRRIGGTIAVGRGKIADAGGDERAKMRLLADDGKTKAAAAGRDIASSITYVVV